MVGNCDLYPKSNRGFFAALRMTAPWRSETDTVNRDRRSILGNSELVTGLIGSRRPYGAAHLVFAANPGLRSLARTCPGLTSTAPTGPGRGTLVGNWEVSDPRATAPRRNFVLICATDLQMSHFW